MARFARPSPKVFVLPLPGVEIFYLAETGEIESRMRPVSVESRPAPEPRKPVRAEIRKRDS